MILLFLAVVLAEDAVAVLQEAKTITVYSLDPSAKPSLQSTFHNYRILRTVELTGASKSELLGKLYSALAEDANPARCFNPRHGLRAAVGKRYVDLVICFECRQFRSYINGKHDHGTIGPSAEEKFNEVLAAP